MSDETEVTQDNAAPVDTPGADRTDVAPLIEAIRVLQKAEDAIDNSLSAAEKSNGLVQISREYRVLFELMSKSS
jgi:hypothetical protein